MTLHTLPSGVAIARDAGGLSIFKDPASAAAIWQRDVPADVLTWLTGLDPDHLPRGRVVVPAHSVAETVGHLCDEAEIPRTPHRDWLQQDIAALAQTFSALMDSPLLRLRLDVVSQNACRTFHVDAIKARLVCTYRGTGTQYGLTAQGADPLHVDTVPTGAPILLRGTLWPETPKSGLLHRSPPIEGIGETRLLLVLDPLEDDL